MYPTMILLAAVLLFHIPDFSYCRSLPKSDGSDGFVAEAGGSLSNATYTAISSYPESDVPSSPGDAKSDSEFSAADFRLDYGEELVKDCDVTESTTTMEEKESMTLRGERFVADMCTSDDEDCRSKGFEERAERKKRDPEEMMDMVHQGKSTTAGELIEKNNGDLPPELDNMLVELDIVKTCEVEKVLNISPMTEECSELQRQKRAGVRGEYKWPNARVPYAFYPSLSEAGRRVIRAAMDVWESYTCIRFVLRLANDSNFIYIVPHQACYSFIGMQVGEQKISIGSSDTSFCRVEAVLLHELGHAIGFWHEQSRPDRDLYIKIIYENIKEGKESQFKKYSRELVDSLNVPYDFHSIMHYPENAFSKNSEPTIVPLHNVFMKLGQRFRLSPSDILQANRLYNCPGTVQPNATHGGSTTYVPGNFTFLIQSKKDPSVCLTSAPYRDPFAFTYTHQALYPIILLPCNTTSKTQRWQWTKEGSIVHAATLLCLTMYLEDDRHLLVLGTCKTWHPTQLWTCENHLIEQPDTNKCITAPVPVSDDKTSKVASWRINTDVSQRDSLTDSTGRGGTSVGLLPDEIEDILRKLKLGAQPVALTEPIPQEMQMGGVETAAKTMSVSSDVIFKTCDRGVPGHESQKWNVLSYQSPSGENVPDGGSICSAKTAELHNYHRCYVEDMEFLSLVTLWSDGWALCTRTGFYVNGFSHTYNRRNSNHPDAGLISGLRCCAGDVAPPVVSPDSDYEECKEYKWWTNTSIAILSGGWFTCPRGYFLKGLLLTSRIFFPEENIILKARCCKSREAPEHYMYCYRTNMTAVTDTGMHSCHNEFLVTEMHRHSCNDRARMCEEEITCCMQV